MGKRGAYKERGVLDPLRKKKTAPGPWANSVCWAAAAGGRGEEKDAIVVLIRLDGLVGLEEIINDYSAEVAARAP